MEDTKSTLKKVFNYISTVVSWTIFVLLIICAIFLVYYYISAKIYEKKGSGYEPAFSLYTIISPSMVPNINVYDVVVDTKVTDPSQIKVGDVITFNSVSIESKGKSVTHRVIEIIKDQSGNYSYATKGDNNFIKDSSPAPFSNITGKVSFKLPQLGRVQFFLASKAGWLLVVVIPSLYVIIKDIFKVLKLAGEDDRLRNKLLFLPIKRKQLYLPFHGYKNASGEKQKFTWSSLSPFTFDYQNVTAEDMPLLRKRKSRKKNKSIEEIYDDLNNIKK
jgi:signal peptidase